MSQRTKEQSAQLCQECHRYPFQYQCPRCSFRSCCLACCQAHKQNTPCSGKRDRAAFVKITEMTDATLQNDYHFLEDVIGRIDANQRFLRQSCNGRKRQKMLSSKKIKAPNGGEDDDHILLKAAAQKNIIAPKKLILPLLGDEQTAWAQNNTGASCSDTTIPKTPLQNNQEDRQHRSPGLSNLQNQARHRGITLLCLPPFMERHKRNETHIRNKTIVWTVEWKLYGDDRDPVMASQKMSETSVLWDELCDLVTHGDERLDKHSCLIKNELTPANAPRYTLVSMSSTLTNALSDQTIIEFPTIHVVPPNRLHEFPLTIQKLETNDDMNE